MGYYKGCFKGLDFVIKRFLDHSRLRRRVADSVVLVGSMPLHRSVVNGGLRGFQLVKIGIVSRACSFSLINTVGAHGMKICGDTTNGDHNYSIFIFTIKLCLTV